MATLKVTQVRSMIGAQKRQKQTLRALGLHRINQSREHEDSPQLRGMLERVPHLVRVETVDQ